MILFHLYPTSLTICARGAGKWGPTVCPQEGGQLVNLPSSAFTAGIVPSCFCHHPSRHTRLPRLSTFWAKKVINYGELNGHMAHGMESQAKPHHPIVYVVSHWPAPLALMTSQEHKPTLEYYMVSGWDPHFNTEASVDCIQNTILNVPRGPQRHSQIFPSNMPVC